VALNTRQQRFVDAYEGDATEAARKAGYSPKSARVNGPRLLKQPEVKAAIEARVSATRSELIATREQRQQFWTGVMRDSKAEMRDRLKAAELLGKSQADFTEKIEHSGGLTLEELVLAARPQPKDGE
jgi:phage terminase small subunit